MHDLCSSTSNIRHILKRNAYINLPKYMYKNFIAPLFIIVSIA